MISAASNSSGRLPAQPSRIDQRHGVDVQRVQRQHAVGDFRPAQQPPGRTAAWPAPPRRRRNQGQARIIRRSPAAAPRSAASCRAPSPPGRRSRAHARGSAGRLVDHARHRARRRGDDGGQQRIAAGAGCPAAPAPRPAAAGRGDSTSRATVRLDTTMSHSTTNADAAPCPSAQPRSRARGSRAAGAAAAAQHGGGDQLRHSQALLQQQPARGHQQPTAGVGQPAARFMAACTAGPGRGVAR
jgi:hypothetical protein